MRRHLTFANVVSVVALFFALSGGSYAAVSIAGSEEPVATSTSTSTVFDEVPGDVSPDSLGPASGATAPGPDRDQADLEARPNRAAGLEKSEQEEERGSGPAETAPEDPTRDVGEAGPPAWAPAHGHRCQQDGFDPGSAEFVGCVHSGHP